MFEKIDELQRRRQNERGTQRYRYWYADANGQWYANILRNDAFFEADIPVKKRPPHESVLRAAQMVVLHRGLKQMCLLRKARYQRFVWQFLYSWKEWFLQIQLGHL